MSWALGIDIGGTNLKAVAVASDGAMLRRDALPTGASVGTAAGWIAAARSLVDQFARAQGSSPARIGFSTCGLAAHDGRSVADCPGKLAGIVGVDWTAALGRDELVPVLNDAHAALAGEAWCGAARGRRDVVLLTLGTGIGGAILSEGRLVRGAIGRAGHLGHVSLDPEGPASIVGMPGAIEMLFGDATVPARTRGRFASTAALVAAHQAGDAEASAVWLRSVRDLACAIGGYINVLDPEMIVIGGGIAQAGEALFAPLAENLNRYEWRPRGHRVPIVRAELGEWAGAIGAARNAMGV
ncbi:MAG: ROK family protein [Opitutaceae bacterium]|nr:ROK family protein [Opitutaceae bacterium]